MLQKSKLINKHTQITIIYFQYRYVLVPECSSYNPKRVLLSRYSLGIQIQYYSLLLIHVKDLVTAAIESKNFRELSFSKSHYLNNNKKIIYTAIGVNIN